MTWLTTSGARGEGALLAQVREFTDGVDVALVNSSGAGAHLRLLAVTGITTIEDPAEILSTRPAAAEPEPVLTGVPLGAHAPT